MISHEYVHMRESQQRKINANGKKFKYFTLNTYRVLGKLNVIKQIKLKINI